MSEIDGAQNISVKELHLVILWCHQPTNSWLLAWHIGTGCKTIESFAFSFVLSGARVPAICHCSYFLSASNRKIMVDQTQLRSGVHHSAFHGWKRRSHQVAMVEFEARKDEISGAWKPWWWVAIRLKIPELQDEQHKYWFYHSICHLLGVILRFFSGFSYPFHFCWMLPTKLHLVEPLFLTRRLPSLYRRLGRRALRNSVPIWRYWDD